MLRHLASLIKVDSDPSLLQGFDPKFDQKEHLAQMPVATSVEQVAPAVDVLGETPVWIAGEGALYWVDIRAPSLNRYDPATDGVRRWAMPELCGAVVPTAQALLVALLRDLRLFTPATGALTSLHEVEPESAGNRLNEAKCDPAGRLWIGSMRDFGLATTSALYRISRDFDQTRILDSITVPNSLAWSPDGRRMYFADSRERMLRAYDFELETGTLGAMEVVLGAEVPGRPDGCTVDAEGCIWIARPGAGCVLHVAPDGRILHSLHLPVSQPTACALGARISLRSTLPMPGSGPAQSNWREDLRLAGCLRHRSMCQACHVPL
jgi:sugar lactone lactonase YvrE